MAENNSQLEVTTRHPKSEKEIEQIYAIVYAENWDSNTRKLLSLYKLLPQAMYAIVTADGEIIGGYTLLPTHKEERFFGNLVVKATKRNLGVGRRVSEEVLNIKNYRSIIGVAVEEATSFYMHLGFPPAGPEYNIKYMFLTIDRDRLDHKLTAFKNTINVDIRIIQFASSRLQDLIAYDTAARGYDTSVLMNMMVVCQTVFVAEETNSQKLVGYTAVFLRNNAIILDGLVADTESIAEALFSTAMGEFPDVQEVRLFCRPSQRIFEKMGQPIKSINLICFKVGTPTVTSSQDKIYGLSDPGFSC